MTKHRGSRVPAPQWWTHLRDWKRVFWKRERQDTQREVDEARALIERNRSLPPGLIGQGRSRG